MTTLEAFLLCRELNKQHINITIYHSMFQPNSIILLMTITRSQKILILCFRGFSNFMTFMHVFLLLLFFFLQDIYYANNKELIKKKLLTKFQTTLITEGEKKGKVLHDTYNYLHFTIIFVTAGRYSLSGPLCRSLSCNLRFAQLLCRYHRRKRQVKGTGSV